MSSNTAHVLLCAVQSMSAVSSTIIIVVHLTVHHMVPVNRALTLLEKAILEHLAHGFIVRLGCKWQGGSRVHETKDRLGQAMTQPLRGAPQLAILDSLNPVVNRSSP